MSRKDMKRSNLELRITHPERNWDSSTVTEVALIDRTSGKTVALMELTLRDYHNLMAGRRVGDHKGVSYLATPSDLAKLRHLRVNVSRVLHGVSYMQEMRERVEDWTREAAQWMGTDEASVSRTSGGNWQVTLAFYIAPADADEPSKIEEFRTRRTEQLAKLTLRSLGVEA